MKIYNLYYLRDGIPYHIEGLNRESVLTLTGQLLNDGCEITGIIDSEKD